MDLSLQNSRPFIFEGSSFETTEHPGYGPAHVHMEENTCALHIKVYNLHAESCEYIFSKNTRADHKTYEYFINCMQSVVCIN